MGEGVGVVVVVGFALGGDVTLEGAADVPELGVTLVNGLGVKETVTLVELLELELELLGEIVVEFWVEEALVGGDAGTEPVLEPLGHTPPPCLFCSAVHAVHVCSTAAC